MERWRGAGNGSGVGGLGGAATGEQPAARAGSAAPTGGKRKITFYKECKVVGIPSYYVQ